MHNQIATKNPSHTEIETLSSNQLLNHKKSELIKDLTMLWASKDFRYAVHEAIHLSPVMTEIIPIEQSTQISNMIQEMVSYDKPKFYVNEDGVYTMVEKTITMEIIMNTIAKSTPLQEFRNYYAISQYISESEKCCMVITKITKRAISTFLMASKHQFYLTDIVLGTIDSAYISRGYIFKDVIKKESTDLIPKYIRTEDTIYDIEEQKEIVAKAFKISTYGISRWVVAKALLRDTKFIMYDDVVQNIKSSLELIKYNDMDIIQSSILEELYKNKIEPFFVDDERSMPYKKKDFYNDIGVIGEKAIRINKINTKIKIMNNEQSRL